MSALVPLLCLALLVAPGDDELEGDTLLLTSGKTKEGRVVYEDDEVVILRKGSKETEYERAEVDQVDSRVRNLDALLDRLDAKGPDVMRDGAALAELAQFAEASRLSGEAELLFLAALIADPAQPVALEALGCRERKGDWSYKKGSKWIENNELSTAVEKWKDRWELRTVHYTCETNVPLALAVRAMLDLERFYRAFYDLFAEEVRLVEPLESMDFRIHADTSSYPEPGDGRVAWFDPSDRLTHVNASVKPWTDDMVHEAVHHVFHMTTVRAKSSKGNIPAWLDEGTAELFGTGLAGEPGFTVLAPDSIDAAHIRGHAQAEKPYDLSRVLAFRADDYLGSVDRRLKYSQSYTLTYFLLYGDGGSRRDQFMEFLRQAYEGKSSMTVFQDVFETESKDKFEETWFAAIAQMADNL